MGEEKMKIKKLVLLFTAFLSLLFSNEFVEARDDPDVVVKFAQAVFKRNNVFAQTCLADTARLPEIRESSPIKNYQLVTSQIENVKIMLANFWDEALGGERLAFIWELTVEDNKITKIRTVFDGANPLMDEVRLINTYQNKYQRSVTDFFNFKSNL